MNYLGKFDAKHYADGGAHSGAHLHLDSVVGHAASDAHAPSGTIVVSDAQLLFTGDFKRSGVDLILSKDDHELVLQDYFKGEKRAVLASPDGAQLSGDLVNALTGHVEYAQAAGASDAAKIIGHVTKVTGSASALRNGVVITLNEGDNVAKGDVVQTGSDSQLGITFIDGSVFGLSSKARMVLNEMVYDPNGSSNSSLLSLVAGTISFVAGETAKHGDMKVNTPVATMGIRGTAPLAEMAELVEIDFNVPAPGGPVKFQVLTERDGHTGSYILYSLTDPTVEIGRVNQSGLVTAVTGLGQISTAPAPPLSPAAVAIIGPVFEQFFQNVQQPPNPNPQTHSPPAGSTPPAPPPASKPGDTSPINNLPVGTPTTTPIPINFTTPTPGNPNSVTTVTIPVTITVLKAVNVTPVVDQTNFQIADHVTIADSQRADTLLPFVPGSGTIVSAVGPVDAPAGLNLASLVSIDPQTGTVTYDPASFAFLKSGEKVTVTVGFDSIAGTDTFHETLVLTIDAPAGATTHWTNASNGDFAVAANWGGGAVPGAGDNAAIDAVGTYTVTSAVNESVNSLAVASGATLDVIGGTFTIENGTGGGGNAGTILADGSGAHVVLNGDIANTGTLEANAGGHLQFEDSVITNTGGTIAIGGTLTLSGAMIDGGIINDFSVPIGTGSIIPGDIDVIGSSTIDGAAVLNNGNVTVEANQTLTLSGATISGSTLSLDSGSTLAIENNTNGSGTTLDGVTVSNSGNVQVDSPLAATTTLTLDDGTTISGGALTIGSAGVLDIEVGPNGQGGANGSGNPDATLDGVKVTNSGTINVDPATSEAILTLDDGTSVTGAILNIGSGGTLNIEAGATDGLGATLHGVIVNNNGNIDIGDVASGATLTLDDGTTVAGGGTGTLNVVGSDTLDVERGSNGSGATFDNLNVVNNGTIEIGEIATGTILTLDDGTSVTGGTLTIAGGSTLMLNDATIGTVNITGDIDANGSSEIIGRTVLNNGDVTVSSDATLAFDNVTVNGTSFTDTASGAILQIDGGGTLMLNGATISGGTINNFSHSIGTGSIIPSDIDVSAGLSTINDNAVLNNGDVTVESGATLTFDNVTVNGTSFTDTASGAILQIGGGSTLTLEQGASIAGGKLSNLGALHVGTTSGATFDGVNLANAYGVIQVDGAASGASTLFADDGTKISGGALTIGSLGVLDIEVGPNGQGGANGSGNPDATLDGVKVTNNGTINVDSAASGAILMLGDGTRVTGGALHIGGSGEVYVQNNGALVGATLDGVAVTNAGSLEIGGPTDAGSTLVLEGGTTISGGALDLLQAGDVVDVETAGPGFGPSRPDVALDSVTVNNSGTIEIGGGSTLTLNGATIDGGTINDFSRLIGGAGEIAGDIDVTGSSTIDDDAALNNGNVTVENHITLTLDDVTVNGTAFTAIANAVFDLQDVTISQAGNGLVINSPDAISSDIIEVDIDASSSINVSGSGSDGIELTSSGASLTLFNAGNITASGQGSTGILAVAQAANGNTTSGNVTVSDLSYIVSGDANGIKAVAANGTNGAGDVTVNVYANATIDADVNVASIGILAINKDTGSITVTTSSGDSITAGSSGINAVNEDTSIAASVNSVIDVDASGTIHSGSNNFTSGNAPGGIVVGYEGGPPTTTNSFVPNLFGNVLVNSSADITADAGDGIRAFNFGTGDVTVHDNAGTIMALDGVSAANGTGNGIQARNSGGGNIVVTTGADSSIDSGGSGINVFNVSMMVPSNSSISVVAKGTIVAGSIPTALDNLAAGIVAGYNSSTLANPAAAPVPGVHGNVTIDDFGSITAAAGDDGIRGLNDGTGTVTITAEASAVITAASGALNFGLDAVGDDGGNVNVTNFGSVTGGTDAINAQTTGTGIATIENHGQLFGDVASYNAVFTNELNADWSLNGTSTFTGSSTLANLGTVESNGTSEISGLSSVTNTGTIEVQSGILNIDAAVSGAGTATIDAGTTLEFGAAVAAGQTVAFGGATGTLILDTPSSFAGKIAGIVGSGHVLDLKGFDAAHDTVVATTGAGSFDSVTNTTSLVVTDQTKNQSVILKLAGDLSNSAVAVTADGHNGADIAITVDPVVAHDDVISNSSAPSGDGWMLDTDNGHFYRLVETPLSWDDAKAAAEADGAYLATITSQAEQDFVTPLAAGNRAWLGGESTDDATGTGHFFWLTGPEAGTAFDFTHWRVGEPNGGFDTTTQAVHIEGVDDASNGGWNDAPTDAGGRDFLEEWGGLSGQIAFRENTGTTIATSVLLANDTDLNNMQLSVTSVGDQSGHSLHGGTVSLDGNIVTYAPAADFSGADSFSYTVSDGSHTSTATVNFNVANTLPVIETDQFSVAQNSDGTTTISGLKVSDADPAVSIETFTETATTGAPGSSVTPSSSGPSSLSDLNGALATVTYNPGETPPLTDKVTLTVADSFGTTDTVNFVFNQAGTGPTTVLTGTPGKDVIFATGHQDILTGGGGQDQFVFKPTSSPTSVQHTVTDFVAGLDKIDVRQFNNVSASNVLADAHQQNNDTLITLDANDSVLLKNVVAANLHANDFIVHA